MYPNQAQQDQNQLDESQFEEFEFYGKTYKIVKPEIVEKLVNEILYSKNELSSARHQISSIKYERDLLEGFGFYDNNPFDSSLPSAPSYDKSLVNWNNDAEKPHNMQLMTEPQFPSGTADEKKRPISKSEQERKNTVKKVKL